MKIQTPETQKLIKSFGIVGICFVCVLGLKYVFPGFDWVQIETALLALTGAWLVNLVKESTGL